MKNPILIFGKTTLVMASIVILTLIACGKNDVKPTVDCNTLTGVTFISNSGQIAAILESNCGITDCHAAGGDGAEHWEWEADYDAVEPHFDHMLEAVEDGTMPEAGLTPLSETDKNLLLCWKEAGFPQ